MDKELSPVPISTDPFIFDQRSANHHWSQAFKDMEGAELTQRTVCRNWRMDHRVSLQREEGMLKTSEFADKPDAEQWWKQRGDYFSRAVCRPITAGITGLRPAYMESFNDGNTVPKTIPPHEQLIHVGSLNNILWRLAGDGYASGSLSRMSRAITGQGLPERKPGVGGLGKQGFVNSVDAVAQNVQQRGPNAVKELAGLLCEALNTQPQPPWWGCFFQEVKPWMEKTDWLAICQMLGLGHLLSDPLSGHWLLVWRYPVQTAHPLYRPTVIEANDNPFHYPSLPSKKCGIAMPLKIDLRPCREVIHAPLIGQNAVDTCTGELGYIAGAGAASEGYYSKIPELRSQHRKRLKSASKDASDRSWISRHEAYL